MRITRRSSFVLAAACLLAATATPSAAQSAPRLEPDRVHPRNERFELRAGGVVVGVQEVEVQRSGDGFRIVETTTLSAGRQTTEILLDGALRMRSVRQEGEIAGVPLSLSVDYGSGRAKATGSVPAPGGARPVDAELAVPEGTLDDNVLSMLLPAIPWEAGGEWTLPVFASGRGELVEYRLRVAGDETVEMDGGPVRALRVEVSGGGQAMVFRVAADAPHELLSIVLTGSPLEVVRVQRTPPAPGR